MLNRTSLLGMALLAATLAGCRAGSAYAPPQLPPAPALDSGKFLRGATAISEAPAARWWEAMGDAELTRLIDKGLASSPNLAAAAARLRQARAGIDAARAARQPSIGASSLYARAELPDNALGAGASSIDLFNLGFDANWEADLWGAKLRGVERSGAEAGAAAARLADAQVGLSAEIARSYVALRAREAGIVLLDKRRALEARIVALNQRRVAGGSLPRQALASARIVLEASDSELAMARAELAVLRDVLAMLTGEAPGAMDALPPGPLPLPPANVAIGDPAAMLARRPDIRAAERALAAAHAQIGVEEARRFPSVSFMGIIGLGGNDPGDLFDSSQISAIALPRLSWNFLDFGRVKAAVTGAEAAREAALATWQGSVLAALQDAEAALVRHGAARTRLVSANRQVLQGADIARLQGLRARNGTLPQADALEAERQLVSLQLAATEQSANLTLTYAALAKSLGLGWQVQDDD